MNNYLFADEDFETIRLLKSKTPKKIWFNVIQYVFEYDDSCIKLCIKATRDPALNRISNTYETTIEFSVENRSFSPNELSILLCENEKLEELYLVRALVYHSIPHEPNQKEKTTLKSILHSINPKNKKKLNSMVNNIGAVTYDYVVHPNATIPKNIKSEHINLVDLGLLICLKDRHIRAFPEDNNDDFCNYNDKYIFNGVDFSELNRQYEFTRVL